MAWNMLWETVSSLNSLGIILEVICYTHVAIGYRETEHKGVKLSTNVRMTPWNLSIPSASAFAGLHHFRFNVQQAPATTGLRMPTTNNPFLTMRVTAFLSCSCDLSKNGNLDEVGQTTFSAAPSLMKHSPKAAEQCCCSEFHLIGR